MLLFYFICYFIKFKGFKSTLLQLSFSGSRPSILQTYNADVGQTWVLGSIRECTSRK